MYTLKYFGTCPFFYEDKYLLFYLYSLGVLCPVLPVSLNCLSLIASSVFSNLYDIIYSRFEKNLAWHGWFDLVKLIRKNWIFKMSVYIYMCFSVSLLCPRNLLTIQGVHSLNYIHNLFCNGCWLSKLNCTIYFHIFEQLIFCCRYKYK